VVEYHEPVKRVLTAAGAAEGDRVRVAGGGRTYEGVVMPHTELSGGDVLVMKLDTGYNVGVPVGPDTAVELVRRGKVAPVARALPPPRPGRPTAAVLGTGGTIASYVDYRTGAVHPAVTAEELVFSVPELLDVCNVRARVICSVFSENLNAKHWQELAAEAARELNGGADAVIIPHGTDTLHFTSAALAFMLRNLTGPVVLVGSQRSSDRPSSDAAFNLVCAARLAAEDLGEVVTCMHHETGDTACDVIRGTKVRKMHSSRRDAFKPMNDRRLGAVHADGRVAWEAPVEPREKGPAVAEAEMDADVVLVQFYPGMPARRFEALTHGAHGVVIAGTGLGHVSDELMPPVRRLAASGVPVVMTTQCLNGRVGLRVYDKGRDLLAAGVIPGEDMLPETALVKLMWVLGRTKDAEEVRELMATSLVGEVNPAVTLDEYVF
jgi:glutamyl-tRNA(Gln) amidotransferase subunit D